MVKSLDTIKGPIEEELKTFEIRFREAMKSHVPLLDKITYYIVQRKGKQVRPMFVFLSAKLCGEINDSSYHAANLIALLHTASLVHDDVVDDSNERRGFFSINALWKNKIAVLVGDYMFAQGMHMTIENKKFHLLEIVAVSVKKLVEGELLQIEKARKLDIKEEIYYEIIKNKTASLIASACSAGAASTTEEKEAIEKMRLFGEKIGIAFQIRDDIFDFGTDDVGKPLGIDIKERKMTLPLIYALNNTTLTKKRKIINIIKRHSDKKHKVNEVIDFVRNSGGLEYAKEVMLDYRRQAFEILHTFPENEARIALEQLVIFVTDRKK